MCIITDEKRGEYRMKERLKKLRKNLDLTQQAFADKIGMKQNTIAQYEMGRTTPSDAIVFSICREFGVNEKWLRNGEGEMFIKSTPYDKAYNRFGYIMENSSPSKKAALSILLELLYSVPDDQWDMIMEQYNEIKKEG
nr:MAG TPA: Repressor protein CI [Caudoviricetes sp.]